MHSVRTVLNELNLEEVSLEWWMSQICYAFYFCQSENVLVQQAMKTGKNTEGSQWGPGDKKCVIIISGIMVRDSLSQWNIVSSV